MRGLHKVKRKGKHICRRSCRAAIVAAICSDSTKSLQAALRKCPCSGQTAVLEAAHREKVKAIVEIAATGFCLQSRDFSIICKSASLRIVKIVQQAFAIHDEDVVANGVLAAINAGRDDTAKDLIPFCLAISKSLATTLTRACVAMQNANVLCHMLDWFPHVLSARDVVNEAVLAGSWTMLQVALQHSKNLRRDIVEAISRCAEAGHISMLEKLVVKESRYHRRFSLTLARLAPIMYATKSLEACFKKLLFLPSCKHDLVLIWAAENENWSLFEIIITLLWEFKGCSAIKLYGAAPVARMAPLSTLLLVLERCSVTDAQLTCMLHEAAARVYNNVPHLRALLDANADPAANGYALVELALSTSRGLQYKTDWESLIWDEVKNRIPVIVLLRILPNIRCLQTLRLVLIERRDLPVSVAANELFFSTLRTREKYSWIKLKALAEIATHPNFLPEVLGRNGEDPFIHFVRAGLPPFSDLPPTIKAFWGASRERIIGALKESRDRLTNDLLVEMMGGKLSDSEVTSILEYKAPREDWTADGEDVEESILAILASLDIALSLIYYRSHNSGARINPLLALTLLKSLSFCMSWGSDSILNEMHSITTTRMSIVREVALSPVMRRSLSSNKSMAGVPRRLRKLANVIGKARRRIIVTIIGLARGLTEKWPELSETLAFRIAVCQLSREDFLHLSVENVDAAVTLMSTVATRGQA